MTVKGKIIKILKIENNTNELHLIIKTNGIKYNKKIINEMIIKLYDTLVKNYHNKLSVNQDIKVKGSTYTKNDILFLEAKSLDIK